MTTYRKTSAPAPSAVNVSEFGKYDEALRFAREMGAHRPARRLTREGLVWAVVTPNVDALRAHKDSTYTRVPDKDTRPPALDSDYIFGVLSRIRAANPGEAIPA